MLGGNILKKDINYYINELKEMATKSKYYEPNSANTSDSTKTNKTIGYLELIVTHSQNTFPVANANFIIKDKNNKLIESGRTDSSGKSQKIALAAIPRSLSEQPGTNFINSAVFYDVTIEAENYIPFTIKNIPIFEEITTLQNFDMTFFGASSDGQPQIISLPTENNL